jgi:glycosyltransferase involved in cell wall biosynthesis
LHEFIARHSGEIALTDAPRGVEVIEERMPLVSIILPVWNPHPDWLAEAIDSAFHESRCQIEVILVDDGSNEPPNAWLSPQDAARVKVVQVPHRGVGRARNIALGHCNGEFIRFLDGDDLFLPESTSLLLDLAQGNPKLVTYGATIVCNEALRPRGKVRSSLWGAIHIQTAQGRFECTIPAMLIPRIAATQVGFDERLIVQGDWDFVLRVSEAVDFIGTRRPVYLYRRHESSLSSGGAACREAVRSTVLIIKGYLARHPELRGTRAESQIRAYAQFLIAKLRNPQFRVRNHMLWKAAAADPIRGAVIIITRIASMGLRKVKKIISTLPLNRQQA